MHTVDFSTSIYYPNPTDRGQCFFNFVEESLYLQGRRAEVFDAQNDIVELREYSCPKWITVVKVIAVVATFFIFPVLMLFAKSYMRCTHNFYYRIPEPVVLQPPAQALLYTS